MGAIYNAIINPIAWLLGKVLDFLFMGLHAVGLGNIAIAIIVFTLLVKLVMLPLTINQSKMMKLNSIITPEVKKIQDKYKDKRGDQNAMLKMQEETKAVYAKYGTSQMGGCIQALIQMPILFALYRVFQYIPIYISQLKSLFIDFLGNPAAGINGLMSDPNFAQTMSDNFQISSRFGTTDWNDLNYAVTAINSFTNEQWETFRNLFAGSGYADAIVANHEKIVEMNTFLTINVSQVPTLALSAAVLIPILSGISQYISVKISQGRTPMDDDNPAAASMKMMTLFMPIMSAFIAFSVPAGLGLYWIATAVFQTILQLIVNHHYDKVGTDAIVQKNLERINKKRAKKGLPAEKIAKNATLNTKNNKNTSSQDIGSKLQAKKEANDKKIKDLKSSTEYYKSAKPGSLAEKAGMVAKYNNKNSNSTNNSKKNK